MELRDYFLYFRKHLFTVITVVAVVTVATILISWYRPVQYDASLSFAVERVNKQETSEYQYDGYYEIQAADLFSQTVISWFLTPSVLFEIYDRADLDPEIGTLDRFANRFKTRKYSPQNIVVRFKADSREKAEKLSNAIISVVEEKAVHLNRNDQGDSLFNVVGETPVIVESRPNVTVNGIVALVAGLMLSLVTLGVLRYLKEE